MLSTDPGPNFIAWWGAGLSTLLALLKFWEILRDRFRIEISHIFTGDPEIGNKIILRNLANRPFILAHWELLYGSGRWPFRRFTEMQSAEYDAEDHRIEPHSTFTLQFSEQNYFDWGVQAMKGRTIFIRLRVAGQRTILRKV